MKKALFIISVLFVLSACFPVYALRTPVNSQVPDKWRKAKTVRLWWGNSSSTDYNVVQLRTSKNKKIKTFKRVSNNYKNVKKKYLKSNKAYKFRVKACQDGLFCTVFADWVEFRTLPLKVKNVQITENSDECVSLRWNEVPNDKGISYYVRLLDNDGVHLGSQSTTKNTLNYCGLERGDEYKIAVRAKYDSDNQGAYSKKVSFTAR